MLGRMPRRHSGLSCGKGARAPRGARSALPLCALLAGACATSAANNEHGPTFGDDAGDGAPSDAPPGTGDAGAAPDGEALDSSSPGDGAPLGDGPSGANDASTADASDGGCTSTLALVAVGASNVARARFAAGQWSLATVTSQGGAAPPALPGLIAFGGGYLAALVASGAGASLESSAYTGSWSALARVGALTARGTPALAVVGAAAHVVYWGGDGLYYHGSYGGAWDAASDRLEVDGGAQSFGSSPPAAAAVGASLVVVQSGSNGVVYDQTWTGGAWQAASAHPGTSVVPQLSPAVVALSGGPADLMVVYVRAGDANDYHLDFTTRTAGAWSAPAEVFDMPPGNVAYTGFTPSLAALPNGGAIVVWLGGSPASPYTSRYTPGAGWSAPAEITALTLASPPVVAPGVCGAAAVAAMVEVSGQVDVATLTASSWSQPLEIAGATGMQSVALAAAP